MRFLSVFSGIEAASVSFDGLGFDAVGFSEIDPFASALLSHHYKTQNYGDITKHHTWGLQQGAADLIIGGSPCQSFSLSGKRLGLEDPRGQLSISYLSLVACVRPRWVVWENVEGVRSSNKGRDFLQFQAELGKLGYGFCWRVLDSQCWGVPQRRRRLWLVAHIGNTNKPFKVLAEPESAGWNKQKDSKEAVSPTLQTTFIDYSRADGFVIIEQTPGNYRRLTITEGERLMGFPDNYTAIPWKGKPSDRCPESLRAKALGNSMCVPVLKWIGERIKTIDLE
jgi:DNA (cytosine-5)-methyltransferase 1